MTTIFSVTDAATLIKDGRAVLIDVREPDEFKAEHIAYALSVPLGSLEAGFKSLQIPADKTILFQCLRGTRGRMACERIEGLGSCPNPIANIDGGIEAWKAAGLPVIGGTPAAGGCCAMTPKLSIFRQVQIIIGFLVALTVVLGFAGVTVGFVLAGLLGAALFTAGMTGWCGLAILLSKMPWNK